MANPGNFAAGEPGFRPIRRQLLLGHEILELLPGKSQVTSPQWTGENKEASQGLCDVNGDTQHPGKRDANSLPACMRNRCCPVLFLTRAQLTPSWHRLLPTSCLITTNGYDKIPYSVLGTGRVQTFLVFLGRNPRCQWGEKGHTERW